MILKFCNLVEPLPTIRQPVEPIHKPLFMSRFNKLSGCRPNSDVLNIYTCSAPYIKSVDQESGYLAVWVLCSEPWAHSETGFLVTTNRRWEPEQHITIPAYQDVPPVDKEPELVQRWLKVLQSAWQRDRVGQSERCAEHGAVLAKYPTVIVILLSSRESKCHLSVLLAFR